MARKQLSDLVFEQASCCGTHRTARFNSDDGAEWYIRHDGESDLYNVMQLRDGRLSGPLRNGLSALQVDQLLANL